MTDVVVLVFQEFQGYWDDALQSHQGVQLVIFYFFLNSELFFSSIFHEYLRATSQVGSQ